MTSRAGNDLRSTSRARAHRPAEGKLILRASDLKQFVWCPRIVFYHYVLPVEKATTYKMDVGREQHDRLEALESRRTLRRYRLEGGRREFRVTFRSERLGLVSSLDLLITTETGLFPVEFKDSPGGPALHHRYQLAAYSLLAEEGRDRPVRTAFLYIVPQQRVVSLALTGGVRSHTLALLDEIRAMVATERMPPATRRRGRCMDCEYRNYCADWM